MRYLARYLTIAVIASLSGVVPLSGSAPETPTLLFHNDGTRSLRIFVDDLYLKTVDANRTVCMRIPFRPGMARLEARSPNGRMSVFSPPFVVDEAEGWYWRIGLVPERDAKLTLRPAERCQTR